mgnify:CR=1 FL=1
MGIKFWIARNILGLKPRIRSFPEAAVPVGAESWGIGPDWAPAKYGEYYAKSALVYSAVRLRADALIRAPLRIYQKNADGEGEEVPDTHPLSILLHRVNEFWTRGDLWRGTSTYLDIWGSAFWVLDKPGMNSAPAEIWLARPDRMRVIPSQDKYIKGFMYQWQGKPTPLLPEEVVWFRHFNPLDEFAGLSPLASARLSADMGIDAVKYNRNAFVNGLNFSQIGLEVPGATTDAEILEFDKRLKERYATPSAAHRPLIYSEGMKAVNLGFSAKEMEYVASLRWSLEDIARVYGVPTIMLQDLTHSTYANVDAAERIFWRTMATYMIFLQEEVTEMLCPQFGEGLYVEFDLSQVEALQPNINEEWTRLRANVQAGLVTPNEARAEMGLDPVPWGDAWWAPFNLYPVKSGSSAPEEEQPMLEAPTAASFGPNGWKKWQGTEQILQRATLLHVKRLTQDERNFGRVQKELWGRQREDVLKRLRQQKSVKQFEGDLFSPADWLPLFIKLGLPVFLAALKGSADAHVSQFGLGIAFDVSRPLVKEWLDNRMHFWANRVNEETGRLLMQEIQEAHELGESIPQIQGRVEKVFRFSDEVRSERIARTEMQAATNRGALEAYGQSGVVESKVWIATMDDRTRDTHAEANGQTVPLEAPFLVGGESIMAPGEGEPANSINCILPGNTVMAGGICSSSMAEYAGPALELRTQKGCILAVTPNHPVLTWKGWKPAQSLRPGDYLVCGSLQQGMLPVNKHIEHMPASIEQVHGALNMVLGAATSRPAGITDFHGDGRFVQGDVHIISSDSLLWCACGSPGLEPVHQNHFSLDDILPSLLPSFSPQEQLIPSPAFPSYSSMGGLSQPGTVFGRSSGHSGKHALATVPRLDAMLQEAAANHRAADPEGYGQGFLGLSAEVALDKLVDVRHFNFVGHVYDLQSILGSLYIASGVFVHNCRCSIAPVVGRAKAIALAKPKPRRVVTELQRDENGLPIRKVEVEDAP